MSRISSHTKIKSYRGPFSRSSFLLVFWAWLRAWSQWSPGPKYKQKWRFQKRPPIWFDFYVGTDSWHLQRAGICSVWLVNFSEPVVAVKAVWSKITLSNIFFDNIFFLSIKYFFFPQNIFIILHNCFNCFSNYQIRQWTWMDYPPWVEDFQQRKLLKRQ